MIRRGGWSVLLAGITETSRRKNPPLRCSRGKRSMIDSRKVWIPIYFQPKDFRTFDMASKTSFQVCGSSMIALANMHPSQQM